MANPMGGEKYKDLPLGLIGSNKFGQYPTMSSEQTFNLAISDGYFVPFAGYKRVQKINPNGKGRGIYSSDKLNKLFSVIDNSIYVFDTALTRTLVGNTTTTSGDVFIAENNNTTNKGEVAFSDGQNLYIYLNSTNTIVTILFGAVVGTNIDFRPGYLTYQNGRFVCPDLLGNQWRLSDLNQSSSAVNWPTNAQHVGGIQTKPDTCVACIRVPGAGNNIFIFGETVTESWSDQGNAKFPYSRSTSNNIDYGCLNPATIAESDNIVCWLGVNEKSGPTIMYSNGREIQHLSTDGIDFKLGQLTNPSNSYAFMFKQYGHLFYVITFPDDGLTYAYDWKAEAFYTLTDENLSYFIAKRVAFFNGEYYFVSINDGNLYQLGTQFTDYDYGDGNVREIPRIRICPEIKMPDQSYFVAGYTGFKIESGITNLTQSVELSMSKDGSITFGSVQTINLPRLGKRRNRLMYWQLGMSNSLTLQYRFYGFQRFVCTEGIVGIYQ